MKINNVSCRIARAGDATSLEAVSHGLIEKLGSQTYPLRLSIVDASASEFSIEATTITFDDGDRHAGRFRNVALHGPRRKTIEVAPFVAVQIIPTGVRCEFGGFAGDACPVTNLLASCVDFLVTHPNAVNASDLNEMAENVLYVEGKSLDDFLLGHLGLLPVKANRIGTFIDPTGLGHIDYLINTLNAARTVGGIDCGFYTVLEEQLGVQIDWSDAGCAIGTVLRPDIILDAAALLISNGAQAIGGVSVIHGVTSAMFSRHLDGELPNPSGGVEAIITHLISAAFRMPTAHAPLPYYKDLKGMQTHNPRAAAEFISVPHYFSVLKGLARAPRIFELDESAPVPPQVVSINNVSAIVVPATCLGGIPALAAQFHEIPLIAVQDNTTILDVTNAKMQMSNVIEVASYLEAAGVLLALKQGISLESLSRPVRGAQEMRSPSELIRLSGNRKQVRS